ncbi:ABC transporter ATP-binding protein [Paracoccus sp. AK26]|uniref:ABC transporter ATP-binding protein n=1 Tax=unclassified Paracoccus (in: a-proteobacteria) TaxID=2688777 RepID=UPI0014281E90|nr:ABC transporter ATP-binding protein [Paracoccus sp. AK26]QIR84914.1 ABC transporter ATP-binding protein [Paracoccus sp. AK26]
MSDLEIDRLSKSYGKLQVLTECNLVAEGGSVVTLLGPSGCGKTTLLRSIAGFVDPDAGRVMVGGRDISMLPPNRRDVAYVFQNYALFPHLTVAQNVAYGLTIRRRPKAEIARRVDEALGLVALADFGGRYPKQMSGGQQQRVAIARALVLEPQVLLLDEPFNALDAQLRLTMQVELRKLIDRIGITSIFVTHDQAEAMILSDKVAVMHGGRIEQLAAPLSIYDQPSTPFVADFIGRANVMPVQVRGGCTDTPQPVATQRPDGPAVMIVRPENFEVVPGTSTGWPGRIGFATALGATIEYEVDCGMPEALRVSMARAPGAGPLAPGTNVTLRVRSPEGAIVLGREGAHV